MFKKIRNIIVKIKSRLYPYLRLYRRNLRNSRIYLRFLFFFKKLYYRKLLKLSGRIDRIFLKYRTKFSLLRTNEIALIIFLLLIINVSFGFVTAYQIFHSKKYWAVEEEKKIHITSGLNMEEITKMLISNQLIESPTIFKFVTKLSGNEYNLVAKHYTFKSGTSYIELIRQLTDKSHTETMRITIIEGTSIKQIAKLLETKLYLKPDVFIKETENDSLLEIIGLKNKVKNLEGFLFPDTYFISEGIDEKRIVSLLFREFIRKVIKNKEIAALVKSRNTNLLNTVILASIIEAETPHNYEKPIISGVYHNRLQKKMKLEADPTVQYILPDGRKKRLLFEDLKINSPYNTYLNYGLPPGPINNPGLSSIMAALQPQKHNYLFFVAKEDGTHLFAETFDEHKKNIDKIRPNK